VRSCDDNCNPVVYKRVPMLALVDRLALMQVRVI
jgi:hypothetical protein